MKIKTLAVFFLSLLLCSCGSQLYHVKKEHWKFTGWLNGDYYQMLATGEPHADTRGFTKRKKQSEKDAIKNAKRMIIRKVVGERIVNECKTIKTYSSMCNNFRSFKGIVENGYIAARHFHSSENIEIIFRVTARGLKRLGDYFETNNKRLSELDDIDSTEIKDR